MDIPRRRLLRLAANAAILAILPTIAKAQTYPSRPVRIVVGLAPGGANDILARLIGQWLSQQFSKPFVVENRPGAATNVATEAVVRSAPDGYTLLLVGPPAAINATLYTELNFNFVRDLAPVAAISRETNVMVVHPSFPAKTVADFIAYAKTRPGKLNFASGGIGTSPHMAGELFKSMTGIDIVHVSYRGAAAALAGLLDGTVHTMFATMSSSIGFVKGGELRPLAVTAATRSLLLPEIPTVGEFVSGYEASAWYGIVVPRNTPVEIVGKLNKAINAGLADPSIRARLVALGSTVLGGTPADFGALLVEETKKWGKLIRQANIRAD
ncbi:MAG: tripartite tricarboxylate transporter substrate binding protein [Xanthobacteraceae bacterium]